MSDNVGSAMFGSCILENVGVAVGVGIALPSVSVQKLFPLPVPWPIFWFPDVGLYRAVSVLSYPSRALSKMWHQPIESRRYMSFNSKVMCTRLFGIRHLEIRMSREQFYALMDLF